MIEKEADTEFIGVGTIITFKVTIEHAPNSHTPAFDVLLTDPIPPQFDLVSAHRLQREHQRSDRPAADRQRRRDHGRLE